MENYRKAGVVERPCPCPFPNLHDGVPQVRVRDGSKIRNLMRFALSRMEGKVAKTEITTAAEPEKNDGDEPREDPDPVLENLSRQIVFTGVGKSTAKAVTCVEIMKRRIRDLHQYTCLGYSTVQEVWEPLEPDAGLDSLTVSRNISTIWVLLSRDPLDQTLPGYQAPGSYDALWPQAETTDTAGGTKHGGTRRKRGGGGSGGGGGGRGKGQRRPTGRPREGGKISGQE